MRAWLYRTGYAIRVWLIRRFVEPQLAFLAERHGAVIVTAERHGRIVLPIYRVAGEDMGRLVASMQSLANERDYWKRRAEHDAAGESSK